MKQPLANMQWLADLDQLERRRPSRRGSGTSPRRSGSALRRARSARRRARATSARPISSRPSRSASSTLPCTGQRTNAWRRRNSQWIRARFHGSELRSYQRHFCAHRSARGSDRGHGRNRTRGHARPQRALSPQRALNPRRSRSAGAGRPRASADRQHRGQELARVGLSTGGDLLRASRSRSPARPRRRPRDRGR